MSDKLNVFDLNRQKTAILQNAYNITETQELNKIYSLKFSMPASDDKTKYIQPFHYVRYGDDGELYRIIKAEKSEENTSVLSVTCEHAIATLCDDVMFGEKTFSSGNTTDAITFLLNQQKTKNWQLGTCEFSRKFEYLWSQENILNALYSIPKEFSKAYKWVFDTSKYKWTVSLKEIKDTINPEYYIRAERNLLSSGSSQEFDDICTRIYPLGYGEGVNQLSIKDAKVTNVVKKNNIATNATVSSTSKAKYGNTYIESPDTIIAKYGIKEKILVDRRFEDPNSLFTYAQTMLEALQTPSFSRSFDVVDLYPISGTEIDNAKVGDICKMTMDGTIAYITKTTRVLDDPGNLQIELSTKATDVADTIADLADRVRIESVYAQGATQLYQHSKEANAAPDEGKGMSLNLYFPSEMKQINKVLLKIELKPFRSYSATTTLDKIDLTTTESKAFKASTTEAGGSSEQTSAAGGKSTVDINGTTGIVWDQGGESLTISNTGNNIGGITMSNDDTSWSSGTTSSVDGTSGNHSHTFAYGAPSHQHGFTIPNFTMYVSKSQLSHGHGINLNGVGNHSHSVTFKAHKHKVTFPTHSHKITMPEHRHSIIPGIFESSERATQFYIYVNGKRVATVKATTYDGDITKWLLNDSNLIPRNSWISMEIRPDKLAYVVSSVFVQGFVQSRGGGNY